MPYRHEWKHEVSYSDLLVLRRRLSAVAKPDPHGISGKYLIRSLYFDNHDDKALREKLDGVNVREKFRIRFYNFDTSTIYLEKKSKVNGLCLKDSAQVTRDQVQQLVEGGRMADREIPLLQELHQKMVCQGLRPKTIVDYTREAYIFDPGHVRVTMDYNIRTGLQCTDFLNAGCVTIPAGQAPMILEVKWDAFLPELIRDVVQLPGCRTESFSKYAACRVYG